MYPISLSGCDCVLYLEIIHQYDSIDKYLNKMHIHTDDSGPLRPSSAAPSSVEVQGASLPPTVDAYCRLRLQSSCSLPWLSGYLDHWQDWTCWYLRWSYVLRSSRMAVHCCILLAHAARARWPSRTRAVDPSGTFPEVRSAFRGSPTDQ